VDSGTEGVDSRTEGVRDIPPGIIVYDGDDDDEYKKLVWPTWPVGALFRGAKCIQINRIWFHIPALLRSR
jgi:hypothetical protein